MERIVIGNWKMNLSLPEAEALAQATARVAERYHTLTVIIAPTHLWITPLRESLRLSSRNFYIASQSVSRYAHGAYTGDVSAQQLKGLVSYCIVGHSERRKYHHEHGQIIADQVKLLLAEKITPVICFGELKPSPRTKLSSQLTLDLQKDLHGLEAEEIEQCIFAYEPVWAIGTGHPATPEYIETVISHVKAWFTETYDVSPPLLYGGSVTEKEAKELAHVRVVDGVLVGGASLQAKQMEHICREFSHHV